MIREALIAEKLEVLEPADAAALFVGRKAEGLTAGEQRLLTEWLARDVSHLRAFERAELAWKSFDGCGEDEILTAMRAHARAPRRPQWRRLVPVAAAAAIAFVALAFVIGNQLDKDSPDVGNLQASAQYSTSSGEVELLQLPDGSRMTLDADSVATANFTHSSRKLELQRGRALFEVLSDTSRPFSVSAVGRTIVAVGTQFDVNIVPGGLTVTLLKGRVDIASLDDGHALVTLSPGQQYIERGGDVSIRTIGSSTENVTAWPKGLINFDDLPLSEAAAIMNRYSKDQIAIAANAATIRVSGQFRAGDTLRFAATLAEMHGLVLKHQGEQIELVARK